MTVRLIPELLAEAVEVCEVCGGSGRWDRLPPAIDCAPCLRCHGSGKVLSCDGRDLITFLARFMDVAEADHFHDHEHGT